MIKISALHVCFVSSFLIFSPVSGSDDFNVNSDRALISVSSFDVLEENGLPIEFFPEMPIEESNYFQLVGDPSDYQDSFSELDEKRTQSDITPLLRPFLLVYYAEESFDVINALKDNKDLYSLCEIVPIYAGKSVQANIQVTERIDELHLPLIVLVRGHWSSNGVWRPYQEKEDFFFKGKIIETGQWATKLFYEGTLVERVLAAVSELLSDA